MKLTKSYLQFVNELKQTIIQSRYQAARLANREQILLYFNAGKVLTEKMSKERWGNSVMENIAEDLQKQMPGLKGFSARNLRKMRQFFETYENSVVWRDATAKFEYYKNATTNLQSPTAKFEPTFMAQIAPFFNISFSHHILLLNKCKNEEERIFYINMSAVEFWSVNILEHKIDSGLFGQRDKLPNNFHITLPTDLKPTAIQLFNDEYLMDYMNLGEADDERDVENKIVANIRDFILRMGKGFSFIGNQFRVELDGDEFFIDLLFFNRHLRCLVAFELKKGKFKPEYAGQLNFYLNVLDDKIKLPEENSSIGIVLCKEKNNTVVEYSIKTIEKGMGVATFKTTKEIPTEIRKVLPDTENLTKLL